MVTRAGVVVRHRDSCDPKVSQAGIKVRTGRKWRSAEAVDAAESLFRYGVLMGAVVRGRAGLDNSKTPCCDNVQGKDKRSLIQMRCVHQLWDKLWKAEHQIKFLIQAVYAFYKAHPTCSAGGRQTSLCLKRGTLEHIRSYCSKVLGKGRYRWPWPQRTPSVVELATLRNFARAFHINMEGFMVDIVDILYVCVCWCWGVLVTCTDSRDKH